MKTGKAIQTEWNGRLFRSRLEARWAVYFESLGRPWVYEPEGYDLPSGRYLPDFWLPTNESEHPVAGYFCEIKPEEPSEREKALAMELFMATSHRVLIVCGQPVEGKCWVWKIHGPIAWDDGRSTPPHWMRGHELDDDFVMSVNETRSFFPLFHTFHNAKGAKYDTVPPDGAVRRALRAASTARFEHGEQPRL